MYVPCAVVVEPLTPFGLDVADDDGDEVFDKLVSFDGVLLLLITAAPCPVVWFGFCCRPSPAIGSVGILRLRKFFGMLLLLLLLVLKLFD